MTLSDDILTTLGKAEALAVPRIAAATALPGADAAARIDAMLDAVAATILPRRLVFTAGDGACAELTARSSRVIPDAGTDIDGVAVALATLASGPAPHKVEARLLDDDAASDGIGFRPDELRAACLAAEINEDEPPSFYDLLASACSTRAEFDPEGALLRTDGETAAEPDAILAGIAAIEADMAAIGEAPALILLGDADGGDAVLCADETGAVIARLAEGGWSALEDLWDDLIPVETAG